MVKLTIDGQSVKVPKGSMRLTPQKKDGIVPTLCHLELHSDMSGANSTCGICMVEVAGRKDLTPACSIPVKDALDLKTGTYRVIGARKIHSELLLSDHPQDCLTCKRPASAASRTSATSVTSKNAVSAKLHVA